jgi:hypothetical protein
MDRSARGNPARIRNCPAAVSRNEGRYQALARNAGKRRLVGIEEHACKSEDLPKTRAIDAVVAKVFRGGKRQIQEPEKSAARLSVFLPLIDPSAVFIRMKKS